MAKAKSKAKSKVQPLVTTPSGDAVDTDALRAKSVHAFQKFIATADEADKRTVGSYYFADGRPRQKLKGWHFVRCGLKSSPGAMALRQQLLQQGYVDAPDETRCVSFERWRASGDMSVYVMAPPEVYGMLRERKYKAKSMRDKALRESFGGTLDALAGTLGGQADISTAVVEGRGTADEAVAHARELVRGTKV